MRKELICLWCGYRFLTRKLETNRVRQCPKCDHIDVISVEEIEKMAEFAKTEMETTPLGAVPFVDTMKAIFWSKGLLRFRALSTLNLESIIYKMAKENKTLEQAIAEVFQNAPYTKRGEL